MSSLSDIRVNFLQSCLDSLPVDLSEYDTSLASGIGT